MGKSITLKIGRHKYQITNSDQFLDNGAIVQLRSQSNEKTCWGKRDNPTLSKRAIKEIAAYNRIDLQHHYPNYCQLFSLEIEKVGV